MMASLITVDNHAAISVSNDIDQICQPLFAATDISFFNFVRIFDDGRRLSVANHPDWLEHYFDQQYHNLAVFQNTPAIHANKLILWDGFANDIVMNAAKEYYDICHGLTLIDKRQNGFCDFIHFATSWKNQHIVNTYINNIDFFKSFKLFFMEESRDLLKKIKPYQPVITKPLPPHNDVPTRMLPQESLPQLRMKRYHMSGFLGETYLTHQEMRCVSLSVNRMTAKEIAVILDISYRTVEGYLASAKEKLGCENITQLRLLVQDFS